MGCCIIVFRMLLYVVFVLLLDVSTTSDSTCHVCLLLDFSCITLGLFWVRNLSHVGFFGPRDFGKGVVSLLNSFRVSFTQFTKKVRTRIVPRTHSERDHDWRPVSGCDMELSQTASPKVCQHQDQG